MDSPAILGHRSRAAARRADEWWCRRGPGRREAEGAAVGTGTRAGRGGGASRPFAGAVVRYDLVRWKWWASTRLATGRDGRRHRRPRCGSGSRPSAGVGDLVRQVVRRLEVAVAEAGQARNEEVDLGVPRNLRDDPTAGRGDVGAHSGTRDDSAWPARSGSPRRVSNGGLVAVGVAGPNGGDRPPEGRGTSPRSRRCARRRRSRTTIAMNRAASTTSRGARARTRGTSHGPAARALQPRTGLPTSCPRCESCSRAEPIVFHFVEVASPPLLAVETGEIRPGRNSCCPSPC